MSEVLHKKSKLLADLVRLTTPMDKKDNCICLSASYGDIGLWVYQNLNELMESLNDK